MFGGIDNNYDISHNVKNTNVEMETKSQGTVSTKGNINRLHDYSKLSKYDGVKSINNGIYSFDAPVGRKVHFGPLTYSVVDKAPTNTLLRAARTVQIGPKYDNTISASVKRIVELDRG